MSSALARETPIRITYIIASIVTGEAGTESHLLRLIKNLDRSRFSPQLVVLQRSDWTDAFADPDIPLTVMGFKTFKSLAGWKVIWRLRNFLRENKIEIVELYFTEAHFVGALAARLAKVPVTISCRRNLGHQYGRKERWLSAWANPLITIFLANSHEVVHRLVRLEKISESRFEVIHNGLDLEEFDRAGDVPAPERFRVFAEGRRLVALTANLRSVKNVQGFLSAAYQVTEEVTDVGFVIMGDGPDAASLQGFAGELGISEKIFWAGSVESVAPYLRASRIGCLSSDSEGFSNALLEYMAASLPIVATRVGGAKECVLDGQTGFLVGKGNMDSLARRMIELLASDQKARQMGERGRVRVAERFSLDTQMAAYHNLYLKLLPPSA